MLDSLNYPILWINNDDESIGIFFSKEELTHIPLGSMSLFRTMTLYSSDGKSYEITSIESSRSTGLVQLLLNTIKFKHSVKVRINEVESHVDPRILSTRIENIILNNEDLWDADGEMLNTVELLRNAKSVEEVVETIIKKRHSYKG